MHVNIEIFGRLRRPGGRQYYIRGSTREEWLLDLPGGIVPPLPPPPPYAPVWSWCLRRRVPESLAVLLHCRALDTAVGKSHRRPSQDPGHLQFGLDHVQRLVGRGGPGGGHALSLGRRRKCVVVGLLAFLAKLCNNGVTKLMQVRTISIHPIFSVVKFQLRALSCTTQWPLSSTMGDNRR